MLAQSTDSLRAVLTRVGHYVPLDSARVADINTNIKNMEARTDSADHRARIDVTIEIVDLPHLERVVKALKTVNGVLDVERAGRAS